MHGASHGDLATYDHCAALGTTKVNAYNRSLTRDESYRVVHVLYDLDHLDTIDR
jgi:hypothetical protein